MFDRIILNWQLAICSLKVLLHNKRLLVFPVISSIATMLVFLGFVAPFLFVPEVFVTEQPDGTMAFGKPWWMAIVAFIYYFVCFFVTIFFNTALMSCAFIHFNGGKPTLEDGLRCAIARLPQIAVWALVSATVLMILKVIQNACNKNVGKAITAILGTAWMVITYFVLPVLVVERVGPFTAIKRSVQILKQTWADALVGRAGIGLFIFVISLPGVLLAVATFFTILVFLPVGLVLLAITIMYFLFVATLGSALKVIFCGALYQYAAIGEVPEGFDRRCLEGAFGQ
jgi:hypothetical protein